MGRKLDLPTTRFSLAEVGDGWDDCHLNYQPLTTRDMITMAESKPAGMTDSQAIAFILNLVKQRFASGQVLVDGKLSPMEVDDIDSLPTDVTTKLFQQVNGGMFDPKDTPTSTGTSPTALPTSEPTETPNNSTTL